MGRLMINRDTLDGLDDGRHAIAGNLYGFVGMECRKLATEVMASNIFNIVSFLRLLPIFQYLHVKIYMFTQPCADGVHFCDRIFLLHHRA